MSYIVDYDNDYLHVDGTETGSYTAPDGTTVSGVVFRRGSLSHSDMQNGMSFGVSPGDIPFVVFAATLGGLVPETNGLITVGGVSYTVLVVTTRADAVQYRCIARQVVV